MEHELLALAERWSCDYIEDAATKRIVAHRGDGSIADPEASNYDPPFHGIHLCGQTDDGRQPTTVASYPMRPGEVPRMFELAKSVAECAADEWDFIVDRCVGGSADEDFYSNRQLWPRAIAAWNERARATNKSEVGS